MNTKKLIAAGLLLLSCSSYASKKENSNAFIIDKYYKVIDKSQFWKNPVKSEVILKNGMYGGLYINSVTCQYEYEDSFGNNGISTTTFNGIISSTQSKSLFSDLAVCVKSIQCEILVKGEEKMPIYAGAFPYENLCHIQTKWPSLF
jgi:hypothetical protein